jgi:hypothetical protein
MDSFRRNVPFHVVPIGAIKRAILKALPKWLPESTLDLISKLKTLSNSISVPQLRWFSQRDVCRRFVRSRKRVER